MHIAFVDIAYGYTVDRPEADAPLGGTTSALCFLARALKEAGHNCTIFNKIETPGTAFGIESLPLEALTEARYNSIYDAFIFCGRWTDWLVQLIAEATSAPLIAWMHESCFGGDLVPPLPQFNGIAFVSAWQAGINRPFLLPLQRSAVLRNAMGPFYATMFPPGTPIFAVKNPEAVYIGATPRGLLHLPAIWPLIHTSCPELTLQIYANPAPSRDTELNARFAAQLRAMPGVTHVGMVGQPRLAEALRQASLYFGPNPYPETSCIALIESMASGLCCVTTARAALPETAHGYATLLSVAAPDDPQLSTDPFDHNAFAHAAIDIVRDRWESPQKWEQKLRAQVTYFQTHYLWRDRVTPWVEFITSCATKSGAAPRPTEK